MLKYICGIFLAYNSFQIEKNIIAVTVIVFLLILNQMVFGLVYNYFRIERNMIVGTVFLLILNEREFRLVNNSIQIKREALSQVRICRPTPSSEVAIFT